MNILVLCTGNSARSILLEAILNAKGADRVRAYSAGSQPVGRVNPHAIALIAATGQETGTCRSKSWDEFAGPDAPAMDVVITVCGSAASETCPIWPGAPLRAHWGVEDPAAAPDVHARAAFDVAYDLLALRAEAFLSAKIENMDTAELQAHLNACSGIA